MNPNVELVNDIKKKINILKKQQTFNKETAAKNTNLDIEINKDTLKQFKKS